MSKSAKKKTAKGIRYTDVQKKEIVDFAASYNAANNGRGGQSKAAEKFNVSPLTVATWLAAAGLPKTAKSVKAPKAPKAPKTPKAPKPQKAPKAKAGTRISTRYTAEEKQGVVDFVTNYNLVNGRGGQSSAAAKYGISPLTVMSWLKAAGAPKPGKKIKDGSSAKAPKAPKASKAAKAPKAAKGGAFSSKLEALVGMNKQIEKAEKELVSLKAKFAVLKGSL